MKEICVRYFHKATDHEQDFLREENLAIPDYLRDEEVIRDRFRPGEMRADIAIRGMRDAWYKTTWEPNYGLPTEDRPNSMW